MKKKANGKSEDLPPEFEFDYTKGKPNRFAGSNGDREEVVPDPELKITAIQELQLQIIALTTHNNCDGRKINRLLRESCHLWRAALMPLDLISLRDMEDNTWHADTLYIYAEEGCEFELEELVREQFKADEIHWIGGSSAVDIMGAICEGFEERSEVILSVWWD